MFPCPVRANGTKGMWSKVQGTENSEGRKTAMHDPEKMLEVKLSISLWYTVNQNFKFSRCSSKKNQKKTIQYFVYRYSTDRAFPDDNLKLRLQLSYDSGWCLTCTGFTCRTSCSTVEKLDIPALLFNTHLYWKHLSIAEKEQGTSQACQSSWKSMLCFRMYFSNKYSRFGFQYTTLRNKQFSFKL